MNTTPAPPVYSPSIIIRILPGNKIVGLRQQAPAGVNAGTLDFELSLADVAILELCAFHAEPEAAWRQFTAVDYKNGLDTLYETMCKAQPQLRQAKFLQLYLGKKLVQCTGFISKEQGRGNTLWKGDLSDYAAKDPRVAAAVLSNRVEALTVETGKLDEDTFARRVQVLQEAGFIVPDVGTLNWGDLRRSQPLCQFLTTTQQTTANNRVGPAQVILLIKRSGWALRSLF